MTQPRVAANLTLLTFVILNYKNSAGASSRLFLSREAESAVCAYLVLSGFKIVHRNLRLGNLEIDVVAERDDLCALVEVRARGARSYQRPLESISKTKRSHLIEAARRYHQLYLRDDLKIKRFRIDLAGVSWGSTEAEIHYVMGAIVA